MVVAELTIVPSATGPSVSHYVVRAQEIIQAHRDIKSMLTPMGTILEGELDAVLAVIREVHDSAFDGATRRVLTLVKIDDRRDKPLTMQGKLDSVTAKLKS